MSKYSQTINPGSFDLILPDGSKQTVLTGEVYIDFERAFRDRLAQMGLDHEGRPVEQGDGGSVL